MRITHVDPQSPAAKLGLRVGDRILTMNGSRVRDELDFHFQIADEEVRFELERSDAGPAEVSYTRGPLDGDFGVQLEDPKVRLCGNDCIFCFVDQSPAGMRETVYVRDEDYRLSFLYGNFITLTNLKEWEMRRILSQRLSPLYISVHSLDPDIREVLFGTARAREILPRIDRLLDGGIEIHTQIVLCPGHNDGEDLERTIAGLAERAERGIHSLAVVPVGLTSHREKLPAVATVTPETARVVRDIVMPWQERMRARGGTGFVYLADEWYRLLDTDPPSQESYDGYPQLEDGIGLTRHFMHRFAAEGEGTLRDLRAQGLTRITLVTGELFHPTLVNEVARAGEHVPDLQVETVAIYNGFFGRSVSVAGLLTGRDIVAQLKGRDLGQRVCLPPVSLNEAGRFMDDTTLDDVRERLGVEVMAGFGVVGA